MSKKALDKEDKRIKKVVLIEGVEIVLHVKPKGSKKRYPHVDFDGVK